jgi:CubicO group peptidase (beta-lactamase class C family)
VFQYFSKFRVHIFLLSITIALAGCSSFSSTTPSPQIPTRSSEILPSTATPTLPPSTATISPTEIPHTPLPPTPTETQNREDLAAEIDNVLQSNVDVGTFSGAVLIARDGEVLFSEGYSLADRNAGIPNTPQTKFRLGALTKQFTAAAILLLQEQGKLNVQDAICDYLSDCPPAWEAITIHHLLTHTSGIPNFPEFPEFTATMATPSPARETINRVINKPLDFPTGEGWHYSNSGYIVLGLIIEQAAGQTYEAFLQENIFIPLHMTATGYDHNRDDLAVGYERRMEADYIHMSIPFSAGGLYSTVEDLYKWDQALTDETVLTTDSLSMMFSDQASIPGWDALTYGYGWFIEQIDDQRLYIHDGEIRGYVSMIAHYPDERVTIIILSNLQNSQLSIIHSSLFRLISSVE